MDLKSWLTGRPELSGKIDSAVHSVSLCDVARPDAPLIYVNRGFENLTGYTPGEVIGRNCRFLQAPETDAATVAAIRDAVVGGKPLLIDILNQRKNGTRFWNRLSLRPVHDAAGVLTHIIGIQSDITAVKDIEERMVGLAADLAAIR